MPDLRSAALNNAHWCAAVWAAHGLPIRQSHGLWFTPAPAPQYYPNVVVVDPGTDPSAQTGLIAELAPRCAGFSVKDSFARLDLAAAGFETLFDAEWLWAPAPAPRVGRLDWSRVDDEAGLDLWERAWRGSTADLPRIFLPRLLLDGRAWILAGRDAGGAVTAGGVGYEAGGAMGVTNVFGPHEDFMAALASLAAPRHIVCYEQAPAREALETQGFRALGPLRVWTRAG